jgi:hypothetical protein
MAHSEQTALDTLYRGRDLSGFAWVFASEYNQWCQELDLPEISDQENWSTEFRIPAPWCDLDVEQYVIDLCPDHDQAYQRVATELAMYSARNLYDVLKLMIYIVDTLRKHGVVWGVGRGSSVASYVLYLIGVHRIDSLKYNLDITEFLR